MELLIIFIILNIVNVILQTVKSICTIKCGTTVAAAANAIAYGLYTIVIIYTSCELPLWEKVVIVALSNFVGVYIVKFIENKMNKDKLWKFEITTDGLTDNAINMILKEDGIKHTSLIHIDNNKSILNCYCYTQEESIKVMNFIGSFSLKYFVTESKVTLPL